MCEDNDQRTSRGQARQLFCARTACLLIALRSMDLRGTSMEDIQKNKNDFLPIMFLSHDWGL